MKEKKEYSLLTTIAMIVGVVIGSGIYFKVDDILSYAGGDVVLGMTIILLGSFAIVFGSLCLSELAIRHSEAGGIFHYYGYYVHPGLGAALGLFTAYMYLPSVIAVVAWVAAVFTLGSQSRLEEQVMLAAVFLVILTILNIFSKWLAGHFQSLATVVKVIPLMMIALVGLWRQGEGLELPNPGNSQIGWSWLSGLVPLYFAYDGWTVVASIAPEIRNTKKNLARAFTIGPMVILGLYLLFFYGLNQILGPDYILSVRNDAVVHATELLYGKVVGKLLLVVVIISVLGVSNGMLLGTMRLPHAFAVLGWIDVPKFTKINLKLQLSVPASLSVSVATLFWLGVHYLVTKFNLLSGGDISEITIVFNNVSYVILYLIVFNLYRKGIIKNRLTGLVSPVMATISAFVLLLGSLMTDFKMVSLFLLICLFFCLLAFVFYKRSQEKIRDRRISENH